MPRLPTSKDLGVRTFQDRTTVSSIRQNTSGIDALGAVISDISAKRTERLDASSLHKAKVHYQKAKLEADAAFDQDQDFETYQERYDARMKSIMTESAKMVRNPNDRAAFSESMSLYNAQGSQQILAKAYSKEVDKGIADLGETLTIGRENYLRASSPQDKAFARDTANDAINASEQAGYVDADKAQSLRKKHAIDLAVASVKVAEPEDQIKILKSNEGVMQYLPLDERKAMIRAAEGQLDAKTALDTANIIRIEGGDRSERLAKVHEIKNPRVKAATKAQVINDFNLEKTGEGEDRYRTYDEMGKAIIAGGNLNAIIAEDASGWESLGTAEQAKLVGMTKSKEPTNTVLSTYHKLNVLKRKDKVEAYHYFLDNVSSFSDVEARKQSDYFTGLSEEPKPLYSMKETVTKRLKDISDDEEKGQAEQYIQEEYDNWAKANPGETMGLDAQNLIVNTAFDEVVSDHWYTFNKKGYELPKSKVNSVKLQKEFDRYARERNGGVEPDEDTKALIEQAMVRNGLITYEAE